MPITTVILAGMLAIVPKVPVLDFSKLPQPGGPDYIFTIRLQLANREVIDLPVTVGGAADAEVVSRGVASALSDKKWNKRQDALHLMVKERAGSKVVGVTITGTGPKPTVRWVVSPSPSLAIPKK